MHTSETTLAAKLFLPTGAPVEGEAHLVEAAYLAPGALHLPYPVWFGSLATGADRRLLDLAVIGHVTALELSDGRTGPAL
jgi:hypothetical protein